MKQGNIWMVNLDPTLGSEIKKSRPCLILNNNKIGKLALKIIAPITDFKAHYALVPWMVNIEPTKNNGLTKKSTIDLFQVRSVSEKRLSHKIGKISNDTLLKCRQSLNTVFEI